MRRCIMCLPCLFWSVIIKHWVRIRCCYVLRISFVALIPKSISLRRRCRIEKQMTTRENKFPSHPTCRRNVQCDGYNQIFLSACYKVSSHTWHHVTRFPFSFSFLLHNSSLFFLSGILVRTGGWQCCMMASRAAFGAGALLLVPSRSGSGSRGCGKNGGTVAAGTRRLNTIEYQPCAAFHRLASSLERENECLVDCTNTKDQTESDSCDPKDFSFGDSQDSFG